jgi:hypothetical protein
MNKGLTLGYAVGESSLVHLLHTIPENAIYCLLQSQTPINEKRIQTSKLDGFFFHLQSQSNCA